MSDLGYYWRNRSRLLEAQKKYYHNLPETKKAVNAACNAKKKPNVKETPCLLAEIWK